MATTVMHGRRRGKERGRSMFIPEKFINVWCYIDFDPNRDWEGGGGKGRVIINVSIVNKACFVLYLN